MRDLMVAGSYSLICERLGDAITLRRQQLQILGHWLGKNNAGSREPQGLSA